MQPVHEWTGRASGASDHVILRSSGLLDKRGAAELARRHEGAMASFAASAAVTDHLEPAEHVARSAADDAPGRLPVRAAWLARLAGPAAVAGDDAFLLARFRELDDAGRDALWHATVEGDGPAMLGRVLGTDERTAAAAVRTARAGLLGAILSRTPAGDEPACRELTGLLGGAPEDRSIVAAAAEHGRHCDACMLLVRRVILFARDRRGGLLRAVAGDLAPAYDAARPAPELGAAGGPVRVWARVPRPVRVGAGLASAAASTAALVGLTLGPSAVDPAGTAGSAAVAAPAAAAAGARPAALAGTVLERPRDAASREGSARGALRGATPAPRKGGSSRGAGPARVAPSGNDPVQFGGQPSGDRARVERGARR